MYDISAFMKVLKERFSLWFNARHHRFGPVWADRFKSHCLEPNDGLMRTISAYIDLNCVRAGMVKDPKDYRFCSYAEAVAGNPSARKGLQALMGGEWEQAHRAYRLLLFTSGASAREGKASVSLSEMQQVVAAGGKIALPELLRCRIRYFSMGAVLGGRDFVDRHVVAYRQKHGLSERVRRHDLPDPGWGELAGLRPVRGALLG